MVYLSATNESVTFAVKVAARLASTVASAVDEAYSLTFEAQAPSFDNSWRAGVTVRVLDDRCFGSGHGSVAAAPGLGAEAGRMSHDSNAILTSRDFAAKPQVLAQGCSRVTRAATDPQPRRLNHVVSAESEWPSPSACKSMGLDNPGGLCETVKRVGKEKREVLAAVSNKNIFHMLQLFVNGIKAAKVENAMVVALDDATAEWLAERKVRRARA